MSDRITPPTADTHLDRLCAMVAPLVRDQRFHGYVEDLGFHYAKTLGLWRESFVKNRSAVPAQGFSGTFARMWEYYLCSCRAGFAERVIQVAQIVLLKPRCQRVPILGELQDTIPVVP